MIVVIRDALAVVVVVGIVVGCKGTSVSVTPPQTPPPSPTVTAIRQNNKKRLLMELYVALRLQNVAVIAGVAVTDAVVVVVVVVDTVAAQRCRLAEAISVTVKASVDIDSGAMMLLMITMAMMIRMMMVVVMMVVVMMVVVMMVVMVMVIRW